MLIGNIVKMKNLAKGISTILNGLVSIDISILRWFKGVLKIIKKFGILLLSFLAIIPYYRGKWDRNKIK